MNWAGKSALMLVLIRSVAGGPGDTDANDGAAASNGTRTRAAQAVLRWLGSNPTGTTDPDYLLMGDLNAYAQEQPITTLTSAGYVKFVADSAYSYIFDAQTGSLDHALGSASLASQLAGADRWHINADEPTVLDYNTEFKSAGQVSSLFSQEPYRSTDHDPVLVGLSLTSPAAPTLSGASSAGGRVLVPSSGPTTVSGVLSDPTDPASTAGLNFTLSSASATLTATSDNQSVVANANLVSSGSGTSRTLKITPSSVGKAVITVTVTEGSLSSSYTVNYAASKASSTPATSRFFTGASNASSAIALDFDTMIVADDEYNNLGLYSRSASGLLFNSFDFSSSLALPDAANLELDLEASTRSGNTLYCLASHSNSKSGNARPNRYRLFATTLSGSGPSATLSYVGRFDNLKTDLSAWDSSNGHGLGAGALGLAASGAAGVIPEDASLGGLNIEGLSFAPGSSSTAFLGFRAPLQPTFGRKYALLIPVTNFSSLVSSNPTAGPASFGAPVLLDLSGRGVREIKCNDTACLILAGPATGGSNFALYSWSGVASNAPQLRNDLTNLAAETEGSFETLVDLPSGALVDGSSLQLLSDNGDTVYYGDAIIAKDQPRGWQKSRSDLISLAPAVTCTVNSVSVASVPAGISSVSIGGKVNYSATVTTTPANCPVNLAWASSTGASINALGIATGVSAGTSTISATATTSSGSQTGSAGLTVNGAADFSLTLASPTPSSFTTGTGGTATAAITVTPVNGYSGAPSYTLTSPNAGITGTFSGNTLNLTVASSVAAGSYTLSVTGTDGALVHTSNTVSLTVNPVTPANINFGAAFTAGNLVIYRVGEGTAVLGGNATAAFLDEYSPTGTLVQSKALPTADNGIHQTLTNSGSATSEGQLNRSSDGKCLVFGGYDATPGTNGVLAVMMPHQEPLGLLAPPPPSILEWWG